MSHSTLMTSSTDPRVSLELVEVKPGLRFGRQALINVLPDVETALFFGKVYELDAYQLGRLLNTVFNTDLVKALITGSHSSELQGYIVDLCAQLPEVTEGAVKFAPTVAHGEILPELWEQLEVTIAQAIKDVAAKLSTTVGMLPGKQGQMVFKSMAMLNKRRPTIGDHRAQISHAHQVQNLVVLDVSGSMTRNTIRAIVEDVVALAYKANAHLAIVSNTAMHWEPGAFDADSVLDNAEFGGTRYEKLSSLFESTAWGTVITVADYDSSPSAKRYLAAHNHGGFIEQVLDISLTCRPTFLAECLGQFANSVRPLLIADVYNENYVLQA